MFHVPPQEKYRSLVFFEQSSGAFKIGLGGSGGALLLVTPNSRCGGNALISVRGRHRHTSFLVCL